ncbi:MAG: phospholipase D-like domain-containing protein [Burkholderiales bacterium]
MFPHLTIAYWLTLHGLVTVVAVLLYIIASHVLHQRRHPTAAIAWVLFILLMPYVALPAFLTFGSRKQARPRNRAALVAAEPAATVAEVSWAVQTAAALGQPAPAAYHALHLHADGAEALAALWQTIDGAAHSIDLCTFIVGDDVLGAQVIERLCARARDGVKVRLMLDGLGRLMGGRPDLQPLKDCGGVVTLFVPPLHSPLKGRTNLRDHRKLLVADAAFESRRVWSGGRNLAAEYFEGKAGSAPWHDLSFDLSGPLVLQAHALFEHDWAFANGHQAAADATSTVTTPAATAPAACAQLVASGPDQIDDTVHALLVTAAYRAHRHIQLVTPYFVPDASLLMALCLAARRGVVVELLLPARSNHRLSDVARRRALRALTAAGARVWLVPHMQHAKLAVIDNVVALTGSTNLDSRSLFLNYELMFAFHDGDAVAGCAAWFEQERLLAVQHVPGKAGLFSDLAEGLVLWVGFQL